MYEKIKKDIAQEYYMKNYPNDGQRFVAWYLRNIHNLDTFEVSRRLFYLHKVVKPLNLIVCLM